MENNTKQFEEKVKSFFEEHQRKTEYRLGNFEKTLIYVQKVIPSNSRINMEHQSLPELDMKP